VISPGSASSRDHLDSALSTAAGAEVPSNIFPVLKHLVAIWGDIFFVKGKLTTLLSNYLRKRDKELENES
jgi:hypothetical protein